MRVLVDKQKLSKRFGVNKENLFRKEVFDLLRSHGIRNFVREDSDYYMFEIPEDEIVMNSYNNTVFYTSKNSKYTLIDMGLWVEVKLQ